MMRSVFYISDRTGITSEALGRSLLTQFETLEFKEVTLPFIDTPDKANEAVGRIDRAAQQDGVRPLVFSTMIDHHLRTILAMSKGLMFDFFETFIHPLEMELHSHPTHTVGRSHGIVAYERYKARIDAVNFALNNDDGAITRDYPIADIILIGVSRTGKTPTCLYLALQYGIRAANYPITEEDLETAVLPEVLQPYRERLFGLSIDPERLHQIRSERRPDSRYASVQQCQLEIRTVESIYRKEGIPYLDTSTTSVEEIAATIMHQANLDRRLPR
jgi:regulator of PEP synthase PpsR (kinase-PPPase family)